MPVDKGDFEMGDEPIHVRTRPRSGVTVAVHLDYDDAERLFDLAERSGKNIVQVATEAVLAHLHARVD